MATRTFSGRCGCGDIRIEFSTDMNPRWIRRSYCPCRFCQMVGAWHVCGGKDCVSVRSLTASKVRSYSTLNGRYGLCKQCGDYIGSAWYDGPNRIGRVSVAASLGGDLSWPDVAMAAFRGFGRPRHRSGDDLVALHRKANPSGPTQVQLHSAQRRRRSHDAEARNSQEATQEPQGRPRNGRDLEATLAWMIIPLRPGITDHLRSQHRSYDDHSRSAIVERYRCRIDRCGGAGLGRTSTFVASVSLTREPNGLVESWPLEGTPPTEGQSCQWNL